MSTIRGLLVTEYTHFNNLEINEIPRVNLEANQVRIKVKAAGVSFSTKLVVEGKYQRKPPLPFTPGTECAGEVIEVGKDVSRFKPGDRIFAALDWGAYAEEAVAEEVNTYHLTDSLKFSQAVNFNCYATAMAALTWPRLLNVQKGETLLVHGAAGAVGLAALELGKILKAAIIGTVSSSEKQTKALEHGADHVINHCDEDFRLKVLEITNGDGADAILDPVGGRTFDQSMRCLAFEGRICPIGFTSGEANKVPSNIILVKNISVVGLNFGTYYGWSPQDIRFESEPLVRNIMERFCSFADLGLINPVVCAEFPLHSFRDAMSVVESRDSMGRVALIMNS